MLTRFGKFSLGIFFSGAGILFLSQNILQGGKLELPFAVAALFLLALAVFGMAFSALVEHHSYRKLAVAREIDLFKSLIS